MDSASSRFGYGEGVDGEAEGHPKERTDRVNWWAALFVLAVAVICFAMVFLAVMLPKPPKE